MKLSIVTTLYYSEPFLNEFHRRITASALSITSDYELIYVNDGSPDKVLQLAIEQQKQDLKIIIIDLSRNFGHHQAGMIGLSQATGDYVFLIDCDLEEAPELLETFWTELARQTNLDMLYGVQADRKGQMFERYSGSFFYSLFNRLSTVKIPENLLTVRLMSQRFVSVIIGYKEKNLFLGGLMAHAGFEQRSMTVKKASRQHRTYTLTKQLGLFSSSITAFSSKPLVFILYIGLVLLMLSSLATLLFMGKMVFFSSSGLTELQIVLLAISFLSGIIISCTGVLGVYLAKIHEEVKQRPLAIIKKVYRN